MNYASRSFRTKDTGVSFRVLILKGPEENKCTKGPLELAPFQSTEMRHCNFEYKVGTGEDPETYW